MKTKAGIRCTTCNFRTRRWKDMLDHLKFDHGKNPKNITQAVKEKQVAYDYSKAGRPRRGRQHVGGLPARKKQKQTAAVGCTAQEIIIPIYLRIPLAFGSISIVQDLSKGNEK